MATDTEIPPPHVAFTGASETAALLPFLYDTVTELFGVKFEPVNLAVPPSNVIVWLAGDRASALELPGHGFVVGVGLGLGRVEGVADGECVGFEVGLPVGFGVGDLPGVARGDVLGLGVELGDALGVVPGVTSATPPATT